MGAKILRNLLLNGLERACSGHQSLQLLKFPEMFDNSVSFQIVLPNSGTNDWRSYQQKQHFLTERSDA